jgi:hypothetical protein
MLLKKLKNSQCWLCFVGIAPFPKHCMQYSLVEEKSRPKDRIIKMKRMAKFC